MRLDRPSAFAPAGWVPLGNAMSEPVLRARQCRACNSIFYVCRSCDRGQRSCVVKMAEPVPVGSSYVRPTAATSAARLADMLTGDVNDSIDFAVPEPA